MGMDLGSVFLTRDLPVCLAYNIPDMIKKRNVGIIIKR